MTGFWALLRLRTRRDAVQVSIWTLAVLLLAYGSSVGVAENFGSLEERTSLLSLAVGNPVILLFRGLPSGTPEGAFIVFLVLPFLAMLAALMAAFLAVRHSRADEESGRADMIAATPAGRGVPFAATLVHGIAACLLLGAAGGGDRAGRDGGRRVSARRRPGGRRRAGARGRAVRRPHGPHLRPGAETDHPAELGARPRGGLRRLVRDDLRNRRGHRRPVAVRGHAGALG